MYFIRKAEDIISYELDFLGFLSLYGFLRKLTPERKTRKIPREKYKENKEIQHIKCEGKEEFYEALIMSSYFFKEFPHCFCHAVGQVRHTPHAAFYSTETMPLGVT